MKACCWETAGFFVCFVFGSDRGGHRKLFRSTETRGRCRLWIRAGEGYRVNRERTGLMWRRLFFKGLLMSYIRQPLMGVYAYRNPLYKRLSALFIPYSDSLRRASRALFTIAVAFGPCRFCGMKSDTIRSNCCSFF